MFTVSHLAVFTLRSWLGLPFRLFLPSIIDSLLLLFSYSIMSNSATPWTVANQAPLSMVFSRQNIGVGCRFLLQGIFPTQESSLGGVWSVHGVTKSQTKLSNWVCIIHHDNRPKIKRPHWWYQQMEKSSR